jgi:hypothetical protein
VILTPDGQILLRCVAIGCESWAEHGYCDEHSVDYPTPEPILTREQSLAILRAGVGPVSDGPGWGDRFAEGWAR